MTSHRSTLSASFYVAGVITTGAVMVALSLLRIAHASPNESVLAWAVVALLTVAAGRLSVRLDLETCIVSFSDTFLFLTALVFGPDLAVVAGAIDGYAASKLRRGGWHKVMFNTAGVAISIGLAARLLDQVVPSSERSGSPGRLLSGVAVLAVAHYALNTALVTGAVGLSQWISPALVLKYTWTWASLVTLAGSSSAALLTLAIPRVGIALSLTAAVVPVILYMFFRARHHGSGAVGVPARG